MIDCILVLFALKSIKLTTISISACIKFVDRHPNQNKPPYIKLLSHASLIDDVPVEDCVWSVQIPDKPRMPVAYGVREELINQ